MQLVLVVTNESGEIEVLASDKKSPSGLLKAKYGKIKVSENGGNFTFTVSGVEYSAKIVEPFIV